MVGLLNHADELGLFIAWTCFENSKTQNKQDFTTALVYRTPFLLHKKLEASGAFADLSFWNPGFTITIDGQQKQEGYLTVERSRLLLGSLWGQRNLMGTTLAQVRVPGFAVFLFVITSNALKDPQLLPPE